MTETEPTINRYAIVRKGLIESIALWDGVSPWSPPDGTTAVLDDGTAVIGGTFAKGAFSPPPPPPPPAEPQPEPTKEQLNAPILAQIAALEASQHRPMREAMLGDATAGKRLQAIEDNIEALRATLTK